MQLTIGDKLGPYEIKGLIGKGGMGEVYRGVDTRLGRDVAIKVSTREFNDRSEREAQAISALNHPNICTLYDVGPNYLVMEFVEGETLASLIGRGPLPLNKTLDYAIQIVDALAAAHAKGVIHRDLKPGNIIIGKNGAKVLDFGLAKFGAEKSLDESATRTGPITTEGAIIGTLHYMSPEQVEAKETDARSDIFSFGVVLYEMISGERPFTGDSQASILAAILKDQPPSLSQRQPLTPRALERVIRKCLAKSPDERWQSARDLKPTLELIDLEAPPAPSSNSDPVMLPARVRWLWPTVAAAVVIAGAALAWTFWPKPQPAAARVTRFEVALPPDGEILPIAFYVRVSPDGSKLAFITSGANSGIWIHDLDSVQSRLLPGTQGAVAPFWSPDNRSLAFALGRRLMRVEIAGGPPQVLCDSTAPVGSGFWTEKGEIVFGGRGGGIILRVQAGGGVPIPVTALREGETAHSLPSLLPDGHHFLYLRTGPTARGYFVGSIDAKPEEQSLQQVVPDQFGATFVKGNNAAGGYVFFVREGTLMAQPFDAKAFKLTGEPVPVVQQIGTGPAHAHFSATADGVMAYRTGPGNKSQLLWLDRKTNARERIGDAGLIVAASLSPDQKLAAIVRSDSLTTAHGDIWILDLARNIETRFTTGGTVRVSSAYGAVWSPDGKQLAYASVNGVYIKDVGGAADAKLVKEVGVTARVSDWTSDGRYLILTVQGAQEEDIVALPVDGSGNTTPVIATPAREVDGRLSPDNHWIAYASSSIQSGLREVFVRPFAAPGAAPAPAGPVIQLSRDGGGSPIWRADGKELLFFAPAGLMSVAIESSSTAFRPAAPIPTGTQILDVFTIAANGQRFLVSEPLDRGVQTPITVVTNWEATLKR